MTRRIPAVFVVLALLGTPWEDAVAQTTAANIFGQRAEQGDVDAQFALGFSYYFGIGVPQDDAEAARWYRRAAGQGHAKAQGNLGQMYHTGRGVPQDYVEAARWTRLAADQGHALAQFDLGGMYCDGEGVPQDYVEAYKWRNLAASRATAAAQKPFTALRDTLVKLMTPAQLAEAQQRAREWQAAFEARQE